MNKHTMDKHIGTKRIKHFRLENMGTHFDPNMEAVFVGCRKELEEYYKHNS